VPGPAHLDARLIGGLPGRGHLGARAHPSPHTPRYAAGACSVPTRERQRERERRVQAAVVEQVGHPGAVRVRDPPPLRQQNIADPAAVAGVDHGEHLEGARVNSRALGLPGGLTAALADLGPDRGRGQQRGGHQPGRAAASRDDVHRLVRPVRIFHQH
jgi:hypothetical protein